MPHIDADITFVDKDDNVIGSGKRKQAVEEGIIHRIVRVLVFNDAGELLIQKRAPTVSIPNRWDNSAAGHVDVGEDYHTSALRELQEEVGISGVDIKEVTKYFSEGADDGISRKRFNTIYTATYNGDISFDPDEVSEVKWIDLRELRKWIESRPEDFTNGFIHCLEQYNKALRV